MFDCTRPKDWPPDEIPKKASFDNVWPEHIQKKLLENWRGYGFRGED
jgi:hypothetical protein